MQIQVTIANLSRYRTNFPRDTELTFPTTTERVQRALREIAVDGFICSEIIILESRSDIPGVQVQIGEYASLDEINYLASRLNSLSPDEQEKFAAAVQHGEYSFALQDLINLTYNLDCFELYPDISDSEEYGRMLVEMGGEFVLPEAAKPYFDYEAYGETASINDGGTFTKQGYILNNQSRFEKVYDGEHVPAEYKVFKYPPRQKSHSKPPAAHER